MDSSFNLKDAFSIAIGWLMVPVLFSWLFAEHGGFANATLFLGLLAVLFLPRKSSLQDQEFRNRIKHQSLEGQKMQEEIEPKPSQAEKLRQATAKL
jgi:hypothetical protein